MTGKKALKELMKEKSFWKGFFLNEIVFDSSSIISVSQNCLMKVLGNLSKKTTSRFLIPRAVYSESVKRPLEINKFELNALRIKKAIDSKWLQVEKEAIDASKIESLANNIFFSEQKPLRIIHLGEAETIALYLKRKASILAIDERTTRMLIEEPENLAKKLRFNYRKKIKTNKVNLRNFLSVAGNIKMVRSCDLIAKAFDLGCFEGELESSVKSLEAALYALKFNGCAVSMEEIKEYLVLLNENSQGKKKRFQ
ncbi:hypothetical protein KKB11_05055 [Candidatus Micrarchaeota archaeon]|nr:hypothetical protein [Candidatus Micrarchaeota archaeon]